MPSHGFARDSVFGLVSASPDRCRLRLVDTPTTRVSFPFAFALDVAFALQRDSSIEITVEVTNTDSVAAPVAFGVHPALRWPLPGSAGEHFVGFPNVDQVEERRLNDQGLILPAEKRSWPRGRKSAAAIANDGAVFVAWPGGSITYGPEQGHKVHITTEGFTYLGLWALPAAGFLCIEPCTGLADGANAPHSLVNRTGATIVQPGSTRRAWLSIRLD
jgi:galactose mutarotase-like enzyme